MNLIGILLLVAAFGGSVWIGAMVGMIVTDMFMPVETESSKYDPHSILLPLGRFGARAAGVLAWLAIAGIGSNFLLLIPALI